MKPRASIPATLSILCPRKGATSWSKPAYNGEVWFTDHHLGRLLDFIAAQPFGKKTAIIVTADHGEAFDEHGMNWHGVDLWDPLVHVPLLIYVPGAKPRRISVKRSQIDLVPTVLDLMGLPQPPDEHCAVQGGCMAWGAWRCPTARAAIGQSSKSSLSASASPIMSRMRAAARFRYRQLFHCLQVRVQLNRPNNRNLPNPPARTRPPRCPPAGRPPR